MTPSTSTLGNLDTLFNQATVLDDKIFTSLSSSTTSSQQEQKAKKSLGNSVEIILDRLNQSGNYESSKLSIYKDYCRNLAAYLLAFDHSDAQYSKTFLTLDKLLQFIAPTYKKELRALRDEFKAEGAFVSEFGFKWHDLELPFDADRFVGFFLKTVIARKSTPEVIIVEKKVIIEKPVEKVIVKQNKVVVEIEKEVINDFGAEGQFVEHKQTFFCDSYNKKAMPFNVCREVCAFLNADGGKIYIGVSDNGKALPRYEGKHPSGVNRDIEYLGRSYRLPFGKNNVDSYCIAVKKEIANRFRDENDINKFINDIHVEETKNDNVIVINVPKSKYCVVKIEGIAYQRSGSECKTLSQPQIEQRSQELLSVTKETHFRELLRSAIDKEKKVILYGYESANSGTIENRYVEPVNFVCENQSILCYDTLKQGMRQFKLSRIGDVKVLETDWEYKDNHETLPVDIFGWTVQGQKYDICLDMLLPAKTLLIENHPNATKNSFKNVGNGYWRLETSVFSLEPVRNFFISFANYIEIRESQDSEFLKQMVKEYVQTYILTKV